MIHVSDVERALRWYEQAFPDAVRRIAPGTSFTFLQIGDLQLELVPSDDKVASGAAGSVVYWQVANLKEAIERFALLGAEFYRGPMQIEADLGMCQVRDPWGNCIGLRGAYKVNTQESPI